ncbi:MAG: cupin domain-containing protein [Hyphomicrobiaceae bacterium]|nr:cupin domain-containing protein [Hyphomicrobiaceae bacterium]
MTRLVEYMESAPGKVVWTATDHRSIEGRLMAAGMIFERWPLHAEINSESEADQVLAVYKDEIDRLVRARGYQLVDVLKIRADMDNLDELKHKFAKEHTHVEDEVRFFVEGKGTFWLHLYDQVIKLECEAGDLLVVPHGTRHWFEIPDDPARGGPHYTAIRLFIDPHGWEAHYTGTATAEEFLEKAAA